MTAPPGAVAWGFLEKQYMADTRVLLKILEACDRAVEPSHSTHVYDWRLYRHHLNYRYLPLSLLRAWGQNL